MHYVQRSINFKPSESHDISTFLGYDGSKLYLFIVTNLVKEIETLKTLSM